MKSANSKVRAVFAVVAVSPIFVIAACDLRSPATTDAGAAAAAVTADPAITTATAGAVDTTAATAPTPIATVAPAGAKHTGKVVNLPNGQKGAVVALTDGGTAIVPTSADGGIPGLSGFVMPTALPSGFKMPTFPPPPAASH